MARRAASTAAASPEPAVATPAAPRRTQRERSFQAGQALLDAAATLFALRGVDQTSLADIGERAGYSRGLANHHFGSRATLVEELAKRCQTEFVKNFAVDVENADTIEVLANLIESYITSVDSHRDAGRAFFVMWGAAIPLEAPLRPIFATDDAQFRAGIEALLRAGQSNGSVDKLVDPGAGAAALVGMLRGVAAQYLIDPEAIDLSATVRACQKFVRQTFAPAPKSKRAKR